MTAPPVSEHPLEDRDVEPAVELPADLPLDAQQTEPAVLVEPDRGDVLPADAGDDRVEPVLAGQAHQLCEERAADPLPAVGRVARRPSPRPSSSTRVGHGRRRATRTRGAPPSRPRRRGRGRGRGGRRARGPARRVCAAPGRRSRSIRRPRRCRRNGSPRRRPTSQDGRASDDGNHRPCRGSSDLRLAMIVGLLLPRAALPP